MNSLSIFFEPPSEHLYSALLRRAEFEKKKKLVKIRIKKEGDYEERSRSCSFDLNYGVKSANREKVE